MDESGPVGVDCLGAVVAQRVWILTVAGVGCGFWQIDFTQRAEKGADHACDMARFRQVLRAAKDSNL
jgi:hypothetical protein